MSQPDPTGESPVTTASRSLATALSKARFASGLLPPSYTTSGDTTLARSISQDDGEAIDDLVESSGAPMTGVS